jgi:hypothetical protein
MRIRTVAFLSLALSVLLSPARALAALPPSPCLQNVARTGDLGSGYRFATQFRLPGLTSEHTFARLRAAFTTAGLRVMQEDRANGLMKAEIGATMFEPSRAVDILFSNDGTEGVVQMVQRYRPGIWVNNDLARRQLCWTLDQLRVTNVAVRPAMPNNASPGAIAIESIQLAQQVRQASGNPARIKTLFVDRLYRVNGRILKIADNRGGYAVAFEAEPPVPDDEARRAWAQVAVTCQVDRAQATAAAALDLNRRGTLVGRFARYDDYRATPVVELEDCRAP